MDHFQWREFGHQIFDVNNRTLDGDGNSPMQIRKVETLFSVSDIFQVVEDFLDSRDQFEVERGHREWKNFEVVTEPKGAPQRNFPARDNFYSPQKMEIGAEIENGKRWCAGIVVLKGIPIGSALALEILLAQKGAKALVRGMAKVLVEMRARTLEKARAKILAKDMAKIMEKALAKVGEATGKVAKMLEIPITPQMLIREKPLKRGGPGPLLSFKPVKVPRGGPGGGSPYGKGYPRCLWLWFKFCEVLLWCSVLGGGTFIGCSFSCTHQKCGKR